MINCYIVDDEPNNIDSLLYILRSNYSELLVVGHSVDPYKAIEQICNNRIDLLFLDIQMPQLNGFELLNRIVFKDFEVIFITAYDQYGIQAVKISALDYLLKPLHEDELAMAIAKAKEKINSKRKNGNLENLLSNYNHQEHEPKIALPLHKQTKFIPVSEIIRCQADDNYTKVYLINSEVSLVSKTLKEFETMLEGYGFLRCHHSHLINIKHIEGIVGPGLCKIMLRDHVEIPISRMRKEFVKRTLTNR